MSKHHNKAHTANHVDTSMSVSPEILINEEIQKRAYQIHEEKGGSDLENWLEAERLLKRG